MDNGIIECQREIHRLRNVVRELQDVNKMKYFDENHFALMIIASGSFVDTGASPTKIFIVETTTIRLNHIALGEYLDSEYDNVRECYADGSEGDREFEAHKTECAERREKWVSKIKDALGIAHSEGGVSITQAQSEVFTVVHIRAATMERLS